MPRYRSAALSLGAFLLLLPLLILGGQVPQRLLRLTGHGRSGRFPGEGAVAATPCEAPCAPLQITALTLNVLCAFCQKDGYDDWDARVPHLRTLLSTEMPDVIALQEVASRTALSDLLGAALSETYGVIAAGGYTDSLLLYRRSRFRVEVEGEVWLGPSPHLPLGWGWQPLSFPRLAVWARLRDGESGQALWVATTHLDNDPRNKTEGAALVGAAFPPLARQLPLLLLGDLNLYRGDPRLTTVQGETLVDAEGLAVAAEQRGTLAGALHTRRELLPDRRIDHILVGTPPSMTVAVSRWLHLAPVYGEPPRRPSDHPAVLAVISFVPGDL